MPASKLKGTGRLPQITDRVSVQFHYVCLCEDIFVTFLERISGKRTSKRFICRMSDQL